MPGSEKLLAALLAQKQLGEILTKPDNYSELLQNEVKTAVMVAAKADPDTPQKLIKTVISRPLADAVYLPIPEVPFQHFYMLQGNWQETCTFEIAGAEVEIPIEFQADGLGGAYYQTSTPVH